MSTILESPEKRNDINLLKIGELASIANVAVATIRYYETLGLLEPISRADSGYRYYNNESVKRLQFIKKAQSLQFSLSEIQHILGIRHQGSSVCLIVRGLLDQKITYLDEQICLMQSFKVELEKYRQQWANRPFDEPSSLEICSLIEGIVGKNHVEVCTIRKD